MHLFIFTNIHMFNAKTIMFIYIVKCARLKIVGREKYESSDALGYLISLFTVVVIIFCMIYHSNYRLPQRRCYFYLLIYLAKLVITLEVFVNTRHENMTAILEKVRKGHYCYDYFMYSNICFC